MTVTKTSVEGLLLSGLIDWGSPFGQLKEFLNLTLTFNFTKRLTHYGYHNLAIKKKE
jgi:hypothetical protein